MPLSEILNGLVVKDQSGFFWVEVNNGKIYVCRLRGKLMEEAQSSDIAAVGDRVTIQVVDEETGIIEEVAERTSALSRAARTEGNRGAGQAEREQVIIANADQALFVFAAASPLPNFKVLDRFLVAGEISGIEELVLVVNKIDLEDPSQVRARFAVYEQLGYPILYTCALEGIGVDALRERLSGHISVFTGPSGVGKTSLLNAIQPGLARSVKSVGSRDEGLHTTRDSALIKLESGGYIADTPGIRTLNLWDVEPEELDAYFVEIAPYVEQCRFGDCAHVNEPGCAVRQAVDDGKISQDRYRSYLQLRDELEAAYAYS
ncbi:MAG: ribosome small subunit-dependent GTPase A [Anaerolineaceae bacterium]|nr:ribosome small subunit-dependent GTPase A [Anaerolineaceae bacterium]